MDFYIRIAGILWLVAVHTTSIAYAVAVQPLHGETAVPESALKPRNHNPHPYSANNLVSTSLDVSDRHKNHVKRRQSPALFNQGPIQFPTTNNNDIAAENNAINAISPSPASIQLQQNNRRIVAVGGNRRPTTILSSTDYGDYDQQLLGTYNKKHYAFSYVVRDQASGDDFSHQQQQQQNGAVKGSYKVQLPDGRTQIVKYTADDGGYKADVSYIEDNHIAPTVATPPHHQHNLHHHDAVHSTASSSPHLIAAEPIYKYYKHLQETQQPSVAAQYASNAIYPTASEHPLHFHHHQQQYRPHTLNYASLSGGYNIPAQPTKPTHISGQQIVAAAPTSSVYHQQQYQQHPQPQSLILPSPTPSTLPYTAAQQQQYVQNVQIETYNTAPHHQQQQQQLLIEQHQQQQHHHPYLLQPNRIVFPTSPTPYQDIHVLPSPRPHHSYASPAPFVAAQPHQQQVQQRPVSLKHTSIVSSPATTLQDAAVNYNYRDYDYQQLQQQQQHNHPHNQVVEPQAIFVATEATTRQHQQQQSQQVLLQPNHALYYKRQTK